MGIKPVLPARRRLHLLEVMEEGRVTVDGETHEVPQPFVVLATENPVGSSGTQMLPESQLDRFMVSLRMGHSPDHQSLVELLRRPSESQSAGTCADCHHQRGSPETSERSRRMCMWQTKSWII